jgi:hypothetical protein
VRGTYSIGSVRNSHRGNGGDHRNLSEPLGITVFSDLSDVGYSKKLDNITFRNLDLIPSSIEGGRESSD